MRIVVSGPQNTGKTTFIKDFLGAFPDYFSPTETYRDIVEEFGLRINQETTEYSQGIIRDFLEKQLLEERAKKVIFDRSVLDNYVYSYLQFEKGKIGEAFMAKTWESLEKTLDGVNYVFFIPTALQVKLVTDSIRDVDLNFVDNVNRVFIETLIKITPRHGGKIKIINGTREERVALARWILENK